MNFLNEVKLFLKHILGYKNNDYEYNHSYGNIVKHRKCKWDKHFVKTVKEINIKEKYIEFIKDFDSDSIEVLSKELGRIFLISEHYSKKINIYTKEEEKQIFDAYAKLNSSIVKLSDGCYAYKNYLLPINDFEISTFIFNYGLDSINKNYLNGKSVIDAGAYIGDSSILFEHELHSIQAIYAFEPAKSTYKTLQQTIELNSSQKIIPVNLALGDRISSSSLVGIGMGMTLAVNNDTRWKFNKETVNVTTLDKFVEDNNITVGLIKTDLEGFEQSFLKGAINTIKKFRPTLMISIYHSAQDFFEIKNQIKSLNLGYEFSLFKADDGYLIAGTLLICQINE